MPRISVDTIVAVGRALVDCSAPQLRGGVTSSSALGRPATVCPPRRSFRYTFLARNYSSILIKYRLNIYTIPILHSITSFLFRMALLIREFPWRERKVTAGGGPCTSSVPKSPAAGPLNLERKRDSTISSPIAVAHRGRIAPNQPSSDRIWRPWLDFEPTAQQQLQDQTHAHYSWLR